MTLLIEILFLLVIVIVNRLGFIYVVNKRLHLSFIKNPGLTFLYFGGMALIIAAFFAQYSLALYHPQSIFTVIFFLFMLVVVNPWIYHHLQKTHQLPKHLARLYPDQEILAIDDRYLLSKTGDVLFQQTALGILLLIAVEFGIPFEALVPAFALLFAVLHAHLFLSMPVMWSLYFTVCAAAGGFILPFIILFVPGGIYYAIVFHMLWYVGSGAFFGSLEQVQHLKKRRS